jgi:hypothetical protein
MEIGHIHSPQAASNFRIFLGGSNSLLLDIPCLGLSLPTEVQSQDIMGLFSKLEERKMLRFQKVE